MSRIFADTSPPYNYSRDCRARGAGAIGGQHAAMACLCHRRSARWTTQSAAALLAPRMATDLPKGEGTDYTIYPEPLTEPYRSRRFTVGELVYRSTNVSREDKSSRYKQYSRNYQFLAPRLSYFSHAKRLTDLHNACFSATSRQFDDLFGYGPWVRRCGRPNQFLALSARACRRFCVVRRLRLLAETAF